MLPGRAPHGGVEGIVSRNRTGYNIGEAASVLGLFEPLHIITVFNRPCLLSYRWTVNKLELELFLIPCPSGRRPRQMDSREPTSRNSKP